MLLLPCLIIVHALHCLQLAAYVCQLPLQHYGVRKSAGYEEPIANKESLLLVNGLRAWHARPIFSTDEHGADKHKMERFLHEGRCVR